MWKLHLFMHSPQGKCDICTAGSKINPRPLNPPYTLHDTYWRPLIPKTWCHHLELRSANFGRFRSCHSSVRMIVTQCQHANRVLLHIWRIEKWHLSPAALQCDRSGERITQWRRWLVRYFTEQALPTPMLSSFSISHLTSLWRQNLRI